jgi:hypothetical protein
MATRERLRCYGPGLFDRQRKCTATDDMCMDKRTEIDAALEIATERTKDAEERLIDEPIESPAIVPKARKVEHRAEDLHLLAQEAADPASEQPPTRGNEG